MPYSRRIASLAWFSFCVFGVLEGLFTTNADALSLLHGFLLLIAGVLWCSFHAEENGVSLPRGTRILCILLLPIGIAYYLFRGFGFKKGGIRFLLFILFIAVSGLTYMVALEVIWRLFG